jgi:hypothetical protein
MSEEHEERKIYLGDGVYACVESGMVKLTTKNGICATNTIYLEPAVLSALLKWLDSFEAPDSFPDPVEP